jgi:Protein of unknown function (DUF2630)
MEEAKADSGVLTHIQRLVAEEHRLFERGSHSVAEGDQLTKIQVELDQCWDLLRQRRALREIGQNASDAHVRPAKVVEKYIG